MIGLDEGIGKITRLNIDNQGVFYKFGDERENLRPIGHTYSIEPTGHRLKGTLFYYIICRLLGKNINPVVSKTVSDNGYGFDYVRGAKIKTEILESFMEIWINVVNEAIKRDQIKREFDYDKAVRVLDNYLSFYELEKIDTIRDFELLLENLEDHVYSYLFNQDKRYFGLGIYNIIRHIKLAEFCGFDYEKELEYIQKRQQFIKSIPPISMKDRHLWF